MILHIGKWQEISCCREWSSGSARAYVAVARWNDSMFSLFDSYFENISENDLKNKIPFSFGDMKGDFFEISAINSLALSISSN
jgi:hypothetical protein